MYGRSKYRSWYCFVRNAWNFMIWILILGFTSGYKPQNRIKDRDLSDGNQPIFLPTQQNYTVYRGHLAVLSCGVESLGTKTVVWKKETDSNPLTIGKLTYVTDSRIQTHHVVLKDQWNLHIRNVDVPDAGFYECQVSTKERNLRRIFHLTVIDKEDDDITSNPSGIMISGNLHVEIGDTLHMTCNATDPSIPLDDVSWFKDGNALRGSDRVRIFKQINLRGSIQSDIFIDKVQMSDTGYYLCRTTDDLTTHKHVQVLNTAVNKDKRGTAIDSLKDDERRYNSRNMASAKISGKLVIFIAFLIDFLSNAL